MEFDLSQVSFGYFIFLNNVILQMQEKFEIILYLKARKYVTKCLICIKYKVLFSRIGLHAL